MIHIIAMHYLLAIILIDIITILEIKACFFLGLLGNSSLFFRKRREFTRFAKFYRFLDFHFCLVPLFSRITSKMLLIIWFNRFLCFMVNFQEKSHLSIKKKGNDLDERFLFICIHIPLLCFLFHWNHVVWIFILTLKCHIPFLNKIIFVV